MSSITKLFFSSFLAFFFAITFFTPTTHAQNPEFEEYQLIATNSAHDWEFFTIGSDHYLAVANHRDTTGYNVDSSIYQWNGSSFVHIQDIATNGAFDWEFFTIGSEYYLVVANYENGTTRNIDSRIYRWNGSSFVHFQDIATNGALDWEFFTIGSDHYLAVANYLNDTTRNIDSNIYRWNGSSFVHFQDIATNGASAWEFFTIGTDYYLAVANYNNDTSYNIDSRIYQWNGSSFIQFQNISTSGARDWEFFTIDGTPYLASANYRNTSYNIDSRIYRWNGLSFVQFQNIPTSGAIDWEHFSINNQHYLAVANLGNGTTSNIDSKIYEWNGSFFVEDQLIPTHGANDWKYFTIGYGHYLVVANSHDEAIWSIDSKIYSLPGNLNLTKTVDWQGNIPNTNQSFQLCIAGPSYPSNDCQSTTYNGGTLAWNTLQPGVYTITETNPGNQWAITQNPTVTVSAGLTTTSYVTNTLSLGTLQLTHNVIWQGQTPNPNQSFLICITGPSYSNPNCQSADYNGSLLTWNDLILGIYTVTHPSPGANWVPTLLGSPASVQYNQTTAVTLTHTYFFKTFTPALFKNCCTDLVIQDIYASGNIINVTIKNQGGATVTDKFQVDLYIDPSSPPTLNQEWADLSTEGLAWSVDTPILPGQTLTLQINDDYYLRYNSNFTGPLVSGTPIYAQVDSYDQNTSYGAVYEKREDNNVFGPVQAQWKD